MSDIQWIEPVAGSTTAQSQLSRVRSRPLPYDLLKAASSRLRIMTLLGAVLWTLGTAAGHVALHVLNHPGATGWEWNAVDTVAALSVLMSLGLYFYIGRTERDPAFILDLGLVFVVLTGLALGLVMHWYPLPKDWAVTPMISWIGAVVLMSAAIVPNSPTRILIAGLIAVTMNPVAMLIARARGAWDFGHPARAFLMHYPDYLLVGVAAVIAHVVTQLGQQVTEARELGSYRLIALLGKGGMGEVWRARHRMLARDAAIKLIHPDVLSRSSGDNATLIRRRFEQEAQATAALRSPHTVELYDFGVTRNGVFYYAMELLDGIDLESLVTKYGPQPPARVVSILRQVCRSLADAHQQGMVHRDIKPTNIFLCRLGNEFDFAKVLDFGLVKVTDENATKLTREGATTGTPAYMPPEIALGTAELDGRTDLYALGCVAYWLITGCLVFEEKGATAMMLAHIRKDPAPPSARISQGIPPSLERIIMMCLAKEVAERPASAESLARMLKHCDGLGSWSAEDAEQWWHTYRSDGPTVNSQDKSKAANADPDVLTTI